MMMKKKAKGASEITGNSAAVCTAAYAAAAAEEQGGCDLGGSGRHGGWAAGRLRPKPNSAGDANPNPLSTSKFQGLFIENPDKQKSPISKSFERKSLTPQKLQRYAPEPSPTKGDQAKSLSIKLTRSSRSFSQEELRPLDVSTDNSFLNKSAVVNGTKMIDEMFKLAREDVQKRIASIDKRLIENASYDSSKKGLKEDSNKKAKRTQSPESQRVSVPNSEVGRKSNAAGSERKSANANDNTLALDDSLANIKHEQRSPDSQKKKQYEAQPRETKSAESKRKVGSSQERVPSKQNLKDSYTVIQPKDKEKVISLSKTELTFLSNKEKYTKELINKGLQQAAQNPEVSFEYDKKQVRILATPPSKQTSASNKVSNLETLAVERLSYSQLYTEKEKKNYLSPKANERTEPSKENTKSFKQLENVLRTYAPKESSDKKRNFAGRTPVKVTDIRDTSKELESYKISSRKESSKAKDKPLSQEARGDKKEVKHFTLRPQSAEKAYEKKTNNSFTRKPLDQSIRTTPTKDPKERSSVRTNNAGSPVLNDKYLHTIPVQEPKIPRSQSDNNMKVFKPSKNPQSFLNDSQDLYHDMSLISTKSCKSTTKLGSPKFKVADSPRNNKIRGFVSPTAQKNLSKSLFTDTDNTNTNAPKAVYLKSLFSVQKPTPSDIRQVRRSQNKSCTSSLNAESVEELLKQNHKVVGIRNNQYVYAKFAN